MRILLDPDPPFLRWRADAEGGVRTGKAVLGPKLLTALAGGGAPLDRAASISYRLHHGGDRVRQPAERVTPKILDAVRDAVRLLPDHNELTFQAMRLMMKAAPDVPHILLCDTAFFLGMPAAASAYAIPAELRGRGARRYGGCGLFHQWAWQKASELCGPHVSKMISIQLGDHSNAAALKDGLPVDTSMGFTPVEGMLSSGACGDIDVSVVFELQSSGMSLSEINELLSARSGFGALAGKPCGLRDLLCMDDDAGKSLARRMLNYDIVKYTGAFAAALGGVDLISFAAEDPESSAPFILEVCRELEFLGLCYNGIGRVSAQGEIFSQRDSRVKAVVLRDDLWSILSRRAAAVEGED